MWNASVNAICDRAHGTGSTTRATLDKASVSKATHLILRSRDTLDRVMTFHVGWAAQLMCVRCSAADQGRNDSADAWSQKAWNRAGPVPSMSAPGLTKS